MGWNFLACWADTFAMSWRSSKCNGIDWRGTQACPIIAMSNLRAGLFKLSHLVAHWNGAQTLPQTPTTHRWANCGTLMCYRTLVENRRFREIWSHVTSKSFSNFSHFQKRTTMQHWRRRENLLHKKRSSKLPCAHKTTWVEIWIQPNGRIFSGKRQEPLLHLLSLCEPKQCLASPRCITLQAISKQSWRYQGIAGITSWGRKKKQK